MARGSGWARIARDCERSTCAKSSRLRRASSGSRDGRAQLGLLAEFVGEIERRVAVAQQADVPYREQALGLRHAQLLEREGEPDALQDRDRRGERAHRCRRVATPRARGVDRLSRRSQGEAAHAIAMCLRIREEIPAAWTGQAGYSFAPRWISSGERWS